MYICSVSRLSPRFQGHKDRGGMAYETRVPCAPGLRFDLCVRYCCNVDRSQERKTTAKAVLWCCSGNMLQKTSYIQRIARVSNGVCLCGVCVMTVVFGYGCLVYACVVCVMEVVCECGCLALISSVVRNPEQRGVFTRDRSGKAES